MKVLILKNKFSTPLKQKLDRVNKWFDSAKLDLEFTEEKVNIDIKYGDYTYLDKNNTIQTYQAPDETWYDENVSKPAKEKGFDIVVLVVRSKDWKSNIVEGFGTITADYGIEEICMPYFTNGIYNFNGTQLQGNKFDWILIHELLHRIYSIKRLTDNTHKYFIAGTPEKCLEDFKQTMKTAILTRQKSDDKQTLGELKCYNGSNEFTCKTLELAWKNNQRNISCIPTGVYKVKKTYSLKFGTVYEVKDVKNRTSIYIHHGNFFSDIQGCILVGNRFSDINADGKLDVINSKITRKALENFFGFEEFVLVIK